MIQVGTCTRFDGGCNGCDGSNTGPIYKVEVGVEHGNFFTQIRLCRDCLAELRFKTAKAGLPR